MQAVFVGGLAYSCIYAISSFRKENLCPDARDSQRPNGAGRRGHGRARYGSGRWFG